MLPSRVMPIVQNLYEHQKPPLNELGLHQGSFGSNIFHFKYERYIGSQTNIECILYAVDGVDKITITHSLLSKVNENVPVRQNLTLLAMT